MSEVGETTIEHERQLAGSIGETFGGRSLIHS
jgi:hypothetical protein